MKQANTNVTARGIVTRAQGLFTHCDKPLLTVCEGVPAEQALELASTLIASIQGALEGLGQTHGNLHQNPAEPDAGLYWSLSYVAEISNALVNAVIPPVNAAAMTRESSGGRGAA